MICSLLVVLLACGGQGGADAPAPDRAPGTDTSVLDTVASDTGATAATGDTGSGPVDIEMVLEPTVQASELVPTVHRVQFTSEAPGVGTVELIRDDAPGVWQTAESTPAGTTDHDVRLLGLKAGARYRWRARVDTDDGRILGGEEGIVEVPEPPASLPTFTRLAVQPGALAHPRFWVLFNLVGVDTSYAVIVDQDGDPVWWMASAEPDENVVIAQPSLDGLAVMHALFNVEGDTTGVTRTPMGALTADEQVFTRTVRGHHAFVEQPDGSLAFLSHEDTRMGPWDAHDEVVVQTSVLMETPLGSTDPDDATALFSILDDTDLVGDGHTCLHNEAYEFEGELTVDFGHANSLAYLSSGDAYVINLRNLDQVLAVGRSSGDVLWTLGGPGSDFSFSPASAAFDHGHFTHLWDGGLAMFSNDLHEGGSRAVVYGIDQQAGVATADWVYELPSEQTIGVLGDIQVITPAHALVSWATASEVQLLTRAPGAPQGAVVGWGLQVGDEAIVGRVTYLTDLYSLATPAAPVPGP